ncbi:MAG: hypothetical protein ACRDMX_10720 [Solirubrobacteraceae bacterium]
MARGTLLARPRGRRATRTSIAIVALVAGGALASAGAGVAAAKRSSSNTTICSGSPHHPGVLSGTIAGNVVIKGVCFVDHGSARVKGSLTVTSGSAFGAIFGHNDKTHHGVSNLTVTRNLVVARGAAAFLGCEPKASPCKDDNQKHPTLHNRIRIGGDLQATRALAVIVHVTSVGGNVTQRGGGGGANCSSMPGIFKALKSPVFSDFEDNSIAGNLTIDGVQSCWLGALRDRIGHSFTLKDNGMADPDAIEIGSNRIAGNLACTGNTNAVPISAVVWDSNETNPAPGHLFPRQPDPNKVGGARSGQCVTPPPLAPGQPAGAPNTF